MLIVDAIFHVMSMKSSTSRSYRLEVHCWEKWVATFVLIKPFLLLRLFGFFEGLAVLCSFGTLFVASNVAGD
jgi:hypothetical protein